MGESGETKRKKKEIESNEKIAQQNLDFQKEKLAYDKQLQQQIFQREDTSYQRTINDMRNAGISPLAMQGTNSAGEAIATEAPQNEMQYDYMSGMSSDMEKINALVNTVNQIGSTMKTAQEVQNIRQINDYNSKTMDSRIAQQKAQTVLSKYSALSAREKQYYNNFYEITDSMPEEIKLARILAVESLPENEYKARSNGKALRKFENDMFDLSDMLEYGKFDQKRAFTQLKDSVGSAIKGIVNDLSSNSSSSPKIDNVQPKTKEDEQILKKAKSGQKLSRLEKFKLWLMQNEVKGTPAR